MDTNCTIQDITKSEIIDKIIGGKNPIDIKDVKTQEDVLYLLSNYRNLVKVELVDNSKLKKGHHLEKDKTSRYVWLDSGDIAFQYRTTDSSKAKFRKRNRSASDIDDSPDSIITREIGTKIHKAAEDIMNNIIVTKKHPNVIIDKTIHKTKSDNVIQSESGLDTIDYEKLKKGIETIFNQIVAKQKQIDDKAKVQINTEQFIFDKNKDLAGTIDLLAIYSNKTASIFDYKSFTPGMDQMENLTNQLNSFDWLTDYKLEAYNDQLPKLQSMLKAAAGVTEVISLRVVPIQVVMGLKPKEQRVRDKDKKSIYNGKVHQLEMDIDKTLSGVDTNKYLRQIPIGTEKTGIKQLDKTLNELLLLRNNLTVRLNSNKYDKGTIEYNTLKRRISKTTELISDIVINKDFEGIALEYVKLIETYINTMDNGDVPFDIDSPYLSDGSVNKRYVSSDKIQDLKKDVEIFRAIMNSIPEYYKTIGADLKNEKIKRINALRMMYDSRAGILENYLANKYVERYLTEDEIRAVDNSTGKSLGFWDKMFSRFSGIQNVIFQKAFSILSKQNDKTRLSMQAFTKNLRAKQLKVEEWGKANGKTGLDVYEVFINKSNGSLHGKYNSELIDNINQAVKEKDVKYLNSVLSLRPDAKEVYNNQRIKKMQRELLSDNDPEMKDFDRLNNPASNDFNMITSDFWRSYYKIDESKLKDSDYNANFLPIKNNKALLEFYEFWNDSMAEFRNLLGMTNQYERIPGNFIPNIKADLMERIMRDGIELSDFKQSFKDLFSTEELEQFEFTDNYVKIRGDINPETGEINREISRYFINPLRVNGQIDNTTKSYDLGKSIQVFASMAYNYNNLNEVEATINALKEILILKGTSPTDSSNKNLRYEYNNEDVVTKGRQTDEARLFEQHIDYHLYGHKLQGSKYIKSNKATKVLLQAKRYQQLKELSLNFLSQITNVLGAQSNAMFESHKSYYFTKKQYIEGIKAIKNDFDKYKAVAEFFQPYQGKHYNSQANKLSQNKLAKVANLDHMFVGFRKGDEHIDQSVLYAMLQNYGIENGKIVRIGSKENIKSLLDLTSVDAEGNLIIDGLLDKDAKNINYDLYNQFRNIVLNVTASIKGSMNEEDMNAVNMNIIGYSMMSFKNWMPAMTEERFRGLSDAFSLGGRSPLRYNAATNTVTESRYTAYISNIEDKYDKGVINFIYKVVNPNLLKLAFEATTFGLMKGSTFYNQVNEERAREMFAKFKEENEGNEAIQNYSFEDYLDYKKGQLRALAVEMRYIMAILTTLMALGADWDDDGKADYKTTWLNRQLFRVGNRYRRELMSLINPMDWISLTNNPITIVKLSKDFYNALNNTVEEGMDSAFGEAEKRSLIKPLGRTGYKDKHDKLYYSIRLLPGFKAFQWLDLNEEDKKRQY
jgi:hypothetical protein